MPALRFLPFCSSLSLRLLLDIPVIRLRVRSGSHWQTVSLFFFFFFFCHRLYVAGIYLSFAGHESSFMDVPRLSTIQALLLLLKARESTPKKGYYYRSWQTIKTMVSMAKDLDVHEHYGIHVDGKHCGLDPIECLMQTRVWQTLLVVELMVGAPQGKSPCPCDTQCLSAI